MVDTLNIQGRELDGRRRSWRVPALGRGCGGIADEVWKLGWREDVLCLLRHGWGERTEGRF